MLELLYPADQILQSDKSALGDGIKVMKSVLFQITTLRFIDEYKSIMIEADGLNPDQQTRG